MKKYKILILVIIAWILVVHYNNGSAEEYVIPEWMKNNAKLWHDKQISDSEFIQGVQYLVDQGIIKIPQTMPVSTSKQIPAWVITITGEWSNNIVQDEDFGKGIQYLVEQGIIKIPFTKILPGFIKVDQEQFVITTANTIQVNIHGAVNTPKGGNVDLTLVKPDGATEKIQNHITSKGDFSSPIILDKYSPIGQYEIIASYMNMNFGTVFFNIIPESELSINSNSSINTSANLENFNNITNMETPDNLTQNTPTHIGIESTQDLNELSGRITFSTNNSEHVFSITNIGIITSKNQSSNVATSHIVNKDSIMIAMPSFADEKILLDRKNNNMGLKIMQTGNEIVNYQIFNDKINTYAWNPIKSSIDFSDRNTANVINKAFSALPKGGVIQIKSGTYTISDTILLNSNDALEGEGWTTILKMANNANIDLIKENKPGEENMTIRNLQIDGNRLNQDSTIHRHGIYISEAANLVVDHVLTNHIDGTGITLATASPIRFNHALINSIVNDTASDAVYFVGNRGIIVNNTLTNWNDTGVVIAYGKDCIVSNNQILGIPTSIGNDVAIISNSDNIVVLDNKIKNSPHDGIVFQRVGFFYAGNKVLISGNQISNNSKNGINMGSISEKNYGLIINDNEITNNAEDGIIVTGNKTTLKNNLIEKNGENGLFLYNAQDTTINGNIITNNGQSQRNNNNYGIEISGDPPVGTHSTLITDNYIFDNQTSKTQKYPINTEVASSNTTIINNWLHEVISDKK